MLCNYVKAINVTTQSIALNNQTIEQLIFKGNIIHQYCMILVNKNRNKYTTFKNS